MSSILGGDSHPNSTHSCQGAYGGDGGRRGHANFSEGGTQNQNNKLGGRPAVRQSKIYRTNESGNTMKGLFGQDHLAWDTHQQQGAYAGFGVHDESQGAHGARSCNVATGGGGHGEQRSSPDAEVPYPQPGSSATCDGCGRVVQRFYHCGKCNEAEGELFDLCTPCAASLYLPPDRRPPNMFVPTISHPTHDMATHPMIQIEPPSMAPR